MRVELRENGTLTGIFGRVSGILNGRLIVVLDLGATVTREIRNLRIVD